MTYFLYTPRRTRSVQRFKDQLDIIKFVCKDFWLVCFGKHVDNLRTNHRGVYVLYDEHFRVLLPLAKSGDRHADRAKVLLAFTCGLIRGGLASVGISAVVRAELQELPSCKFNLEMLPA
eukprot:UC1_evm1s531